MKNRSRLIFVTTILVTALFVNVSSVWAEKGNTPESVVKSFAGAYFMLDDTMADYLAQGALVNENGVNMVDLYFQVKNQEARSRGYDMNYLKMRPILMKTQVVSEDDSTATIALTAVLIRSINPLYRMVGYVFGLLEEHEIRTTVTVIKENGTWKIGSGALGLSA